MTNQVLEFSDGSEYSKVIVRDAFMGRRGATMPYHATYCRRNDP